MTPRGPWRRRPGQRRKPCARGAKPTHADAENRTINGNKGEKSQREVSEEELSGEVTSSGLCMFLTVR